MTIPHTAGTGVGPEEHLVYQDEAVGVGAANENDQVAGKGFGCRSGNMRLARLGKPGRPKASGVADSLSDDDVDLRSSVED